MIKTNGEELVVGFPAEEINNIIDGVDTHVIKIDSSNIFDQFLNKQVFMPKKYAETEFNYKHICSYGIVINEDKKILVYQRTKTSGEKRLMAKKSIGWGGHININDKDIDDGVNREFFEELNSDEFMDYTEISKDAFMINYNNDEVGKVHVGLCHIYDIGLSEVKSAEDKNVIQGWYSFEELLESELFNELETWSQSLILYLKSASDEIIDTFHSDQINTISLNGAFERLLENFIF